MYPRIEINLNAIRANAKEIVEACGKRNIDVVGVTKVCCGSRKVARALLDGGIEILADSRIQNLKKLSPLEVPFMLLRIPMLSEVEAVVKYADISLNTEKKVIEALSKEARKRGKTHKVILMVDVGDRREGCMPDEILQLVDEVSNFEGIEILGLGTNVGCFGGILPTKENTKILIELADLVQNKLGIELSTISAGTTVTLSLLEKGDLPQDVNQFRLGESIILGTDVTGDREIEWLRQDTATISAEIIECKDKPFQPEGKTGKDAFGREPQFSHRGIRSRAILGIGEQDTNPLNLTPLSDGVEILGSSSDHTIVDIDDRKDLKLGDIVHFRPDYGCLLGAMTSGYVKKRYIG